MKNINLEIENCPPNADAMIQSMRAVGYDLSRAIADIIDNSISAGAKNIWIIQKWGGSNSYIAVLDDGSGMDESTLFEAMRLGSRSPLEKREPFDLGRFGLGLKTASFSQCKQLTVRTKKTKNQLFTRCWDLDFVTKSKKWSLLKSTSNKIDKLLLPLDKVKHGTIVIWQKMDRIVEVDDADHEQGKNNFLRKINDVKKYLEMVFHRYIGIGGKVNIYLAGTDNFEEEYNKLKPWDPFLSKHAATQELSNEAFSIFGNKIRVKPFILPHISKMTSIEHANASGPKGWNAQQGFYIYRKERLIVAGGWLDSGYKQEEHCKLARILVDIPNNMDDEWKIDVKKAEAHPPDTLRTAFRRISKLAREGASNVYRHRGRMELRRNDNINRFIWKKINNRGKVFYKVDRKHPLVAEFLIKHKNIKKDINTLMKLVEQTVPIEQIVITNSETPDAHILADSMNYFDDMPIKKWFIDQVMIQRAKGLSKKEAFQLVLTLEPFNNYPELISMIEEI